MTQEAIAQRILKGIAATHSGLVNICSGNSLLTVQLQAIT